jgi:hypothetical protein
VRAPISSLERHSAGFELIGLPSIPSRLGLPEAPRFPRSGPGEFPKALEEVRVAYSFGGLDLGPLGLQVAFSMQPCAPRRIQLLNARLIARS